MVKGIEKYHHPSFNGYMYLHDDLLLSPAKMLTLDKTKLWISNKMESNTLEPWSSRGWGWFWFNDQSSGISAMQRVYDAHPDIEAIMKQCTDTKIVKDHKPGNSHTIYHGHSDFLYIPKSMVSSYLYHMGAFSKHELFLEIAVATWAKCFSPNYDTEAIELEICTTWDYSERSEIMKWVER
eukprot:gene24488-30839_t